MSFNKTVRLVLGLVVNAGGTLVLTYFVVVAILSFNFGLKGIIKSTPYNTDRHGQLNVEQDNIIRQNSHQAKILGWINILISLTSTVTSTLIIVLWTFLNSKLKKKKNGDHQRTIPFRKMLLTLGLLSLILLLTLLIIQFSFAAWFIPFFTGTANYVGGIASLTLLALYLFTYFIVFGSSVVAERCCKEEDYYDHVAYGLTDEQRAKNRRIARVLQALVIRR